MESESGDYYTTSVHFGRVLEKFRPDSVGLLSYLGSFTQMSEFIQYPVEMLKILL